MDDLFETTSGRQLRRRWTLLADAEQVDGALVRQTALPLFFFPALSLHFASRNPSLHSLSLYPWRDQQQRHGD